MIRDILCPSCKKVFVVLDQEFDEKLNLICSHCKTIIFSTSEEDEINLRKNFTSSLYPPHTSWSNQGSKELIPISVKASKGN